MQKRATGGKNVIKSVDYNNITDKLSNVDKSFMKDEEITTVLEERELWDNNATVLLDNASLKINGFEIYLDIIKIHTNEKI